MTPFLVTVSGMKSVQNRFATISWKAQLIGQTNQYERVGSITVWYYHFSYDKVTWSDWNLFRIEAHSILSGYRRMSLFFNIS